jgi:hypothetical protein
MLVASLVPITTERIDSRRIRGVSKMNRKILTGILCGIFVSVISVFTFYGLSLSGVLADNWFYGDWLGEYGGLGGTLGYATLLVLSALIGYSIARLHGRVLKAAVLAWVSVLSVFAALAFIAS